MERGYTQEQDAGRNVVYSVGREKVAWALLEVTKAELLKKLYFVGGSSLEIPLQESEE
jgi:hypothetical protein